MTESHSSIERLQWSRQVRRGRVEGRGGARGRGWRLPVAAGAEAMWCIDDVSNKGSFSLVLL